MDTEAGREPVATKVVEMIKTGQTALNAIENIQFGVNIDGLVFTNTSNLKKLESTGLR